MLRGEHQVTLAASTARAAADSIACRTGDSAVAKLLSRSTCSAVAHVDVYPSPCSALKYAASPPSRRSSGSKVRSWVMKNIACQLEHSVEAEVNPSFAWSWRTDIDNWDDPPAQFQLDGPFASGSWGTTLLPGREPLRWQIRDVRHGAAFIIDVPLDGAVMSFEWLFDAVSNHQTRITQRIVLSGDNAAAYVNQVQAGFGSNLPDGMKRIADTMARAERSTDGGDDE